MARTKGICTYCGTFGPLHMDHLPPENLFERGQKSNLVTVPCCHRCNSTASKKISVALFLSPFAKKQNRNKNTTTFGPMRFACSTYPLAIYE